MGFINDKNGMGITNLWVDKNKIILMEWKQYEPR